MPHVRAARAAARFASPSVADAGQPVVDAGGADDLAVAPGGLRRGPVAVGLHEVERRVAGGHHDPHRAVGVLPGRERAAVDGPVAGHARRRGVGEVERDDVRCGCRRAGRAGTSGRRGRRPGRTRAGSSPTTTTWSSRSSSSGGTSAGPGSRCGTARAGASPVTSVTTRRRPRDPRPPASRRSSRRRTRRRRPPGCSCRWRCCRPPPAASRGARRGRAARRTSGTGPPPEAVGPDQRERLVDVPLAQLLAVVERRQLRRPRPGVAAAAVRAQRGVEQRDRRPRRPPPPAAKVLSPRSLRASPSPICRPRRGGGTRRGPRGSPAAAPGRVRPSPALEETACPTASSTSSCSAPPASPAG